MATCYLHYWDGLDFSHCTAPKGGVDQPIGRRLIEFKTLKPIKDSFTKELEMEIRAVSKVLFAVPRKVSKLQKMPQSHENPKGKLVLFWFQSLKS